MSLIDHESFERLTPIKQRFVTTVDRIATSPGDSTPDIIRQGRVELWPGCTVLAWIIDVEAPLGMANPRKYLFCLDAEHGEKTVEDISVRISDGETNVAMEEGTVDVYAGPAPEYAIESFLDRYPADKVAI